jgi:TRAP-type mannitol/chloroaromatic compound transport system permease small subunit
MSEAKGTNPDSGSWESAALRLSDVLKTFVDRIGRGGSWLILPVVLITVLDATARKMPKLQIWVVENVSSYFGSTILQELEWHFHTGLFALVLGYGFIYNTHVRVDLIRENLSFRNKARLEFWGLTLFMIPFCGIIIWFAVDWIHSSYAMGEISASQVGLSHRWIIKSVLLAGLCVALISGVSVWLQVAVVLWGSQGMRFPLMTLEWPEEDTKVEGKERLVLDEDTIAAMEASDDAPAADATASSP